jgi:hypothetical protein
VLYCDSSHTADCALRHNLGHAREILSTYMANEPVPPVAAVPAAIEMPPEAVYRHALANPAVPKVYVSTFALVIQPLDIALLLGQAGNPNAVVSMSYPVAKTLGARIEKAIAEYEKLTQVTVADAEALEKTFRENQQKS